MKYYKDQNNNIYAYETDGSQDAFVLEGLVLITDEEADTLRNSFIIPVTISQRIEDLEKEHSLPRPVRDVLLPLMEREAAALGVSPAQLRVVNSGYRKVKELDEQIAALRALL